MDLSIIIINYKTKKVIADCLKTIQNSTDKLKKEVIVVDNGSSDDSVAYLKQKFPWAKVYSSGANLGFAGGNNFGVKKAAGQYLWFLNSDTLLHQTTIQTFYDLVLQHNSQIASCRLLNKNNTIQPQGGFLPKLRRLAFWMFFIDDLPLINCLIKPYQQRKISFFKKDRHPGWLGGTALMVKKDLYLKMKGFDQKIFMYGEDVELCLRAQKEGIKLDYFSKPNLVHLGQASGSSQGAVLGEFKGLKYIYQKHQPQWEYPFLRFLLKTGALLRIIIFGIILKDEVKKDIYTKAFKLA